MKVTPKNHPTLDPTRALSWSAISSFEWNRDQWWRKYVGKEIPEITPELEFGSMVDKRIQEDPTFLPKLERFPVMQHKMECVFNDIPLIGIADQFDPNPKHIRLADDKTGRRIWDQKRADETGQLTMYSLELWLTQKIRPEDIDFEIRWFPTHYKDGKIAFIEEYHTKLQPVVIRTKRTMREVLAFGQRIIDTYTAMHEYAAHRPILDTCDYNQW